MFFLPPSRDEKERNRVSGGALQIATIVHGHYWTWDACDGLGLGNLMGRGEWTLWEEDKKKRVWGLEIRLSGAVLGAGKDGRRMVVNLDGTEHIMGLFRLSYRLWPCRLSTFVIILLPPRL